MKTFKNICAQGDMILRRIETIPTDAVPVKSENGSLIITHSETGHNHIVMERQNKNGGKNAQLFINKINALIGYLSVSEPCELEHLRSHDTHASISIPVGNYEIRRQREYTPEGFRRAQD